MTRLEFDNGLLLVRDHYFYDRGGNRGSKETEELDRLRRENAELKRTNEILRLASRFSPRRPTGPGAGRDVCGDTS
jgi:transposase-like protein